MSAAPRSPRSRRATLRLAAALGAVGFAAPEGATAKRRRDRCPRGAIAIGFGEPKEALVAFVAKAGMATIAVPRSENADTFKPSFSDGERNPITVLSRKIDPDLPARIEAHTTDVDGVTKVCTYSF